jgi:two-component system sensor histidine kinase RegB
MPFGKSRHKIHPSRQNLSRLWLIRSILILALLAITLWLRVQGTFELPWLPLFLILGAMIVFNGLVLWRLQLHWPVSEAEFFANLLLDVGFLTLVLYLTGGSTNPLVSYYLIPLIISAAVLRPALTWIIAFLSIALYTLLLFHYQPLSSFSAASQGSMMSAHFLGMWVNFGFSAVLISWFVVRMASTLREKERAIARGREAGLRDEQIISVASIAAGTAHELRTPLATMAVTVDELRDDHPELAEDLAVLELQIERCDRTLRELVSTTTEDSRRIVTSIGRMVASLLDKWSLARPETRLRLDCPANVSEKEISYDQSLQHALMNFLNNAADVSPEFVALTVTADSSTAAFLIADHGPGIPTEIAGQLGRTYVSRREGGLGLGILLSQASIERLGGKVTLTGVTDGGTRLEIRFPLHQANQNG